MLHIHKHKDTLEIMHHTGAFIQLEKIYMKEVILNYNLSRPLKIKIWLFIHLTFFWIKSSCCLM